MSTSKKTVNNPLRPLFKGFTDWFETLNHKKIAKWLVVAALIIAIGSSYFWYTRVYMNGERRFWIAIENSLSTKSVVRTLNQGGTGNQVVQKYRLNFAPQRVIENNVEFTTRSATENTRIVTEGIITPQDQFLRYTEFEDEGGNDLDSVLGLWAQESSNEQNAEDARINFVSEHVTLVIFGNFNPNYRNQVIKQLQDRNVYSGTLMNPFEIEKDGEKLLVYNLKLDIRAYAEILGNAFVDAGYGEFPPLEPSRYREGAQVGVEITVNKRTNKVADVVFGGRAESYSNYGVIKDVTLPTVTISIPELQQKVQEALIQ